MYQFKSVQGITFPVKVKDILYIESQRPRIKVVLSYDELLTRKKLDELEEEFKEVTSDFVRIHKSYLINLCHIREYTSKTVTMMNGTELPIRRKYLENFIEKKTKKLI